MKLLKTTIVCALLVTLMASLTMINVGTSSSTPVIYVDPPVSWGKPGDPVNINVNIKDVEAGTNKSLYTWEFDMSYDSSLLKLVEETDTLDNELVNDTVTVHQLPIASFFIKESPPYKKNTDYTFNASLSTPDGGQLIDPDSYHWDFGDSNTGIGKVIVHKFTLNGYYTVILNVTDTEGEWDTDEQIIPIGVPPLSAMSPTQGLLGETDASNNAPVNSGSTTSGSLIRDVAVTKVIALTHTVVGGDTAYVAITVQNSPMGYQRESFTVTAYANTTKIGETTGSLNPGESQTYTIPWTTTLMTQTGTYKIKGVVPKLPSVAEGPFLKNVGSTWWTEPIVTPPGIVIATDTLYPYVFPGGASGEGTLATIFFEVIAEGKTTLDIYESGLRTYDGEHVSPLSHSTVDGVFTILGDVGGDGKVDALDLFAVGKAYGTASGETNWNPNCDFNKDGKVDKSDLSNLSKNYGKS